MGRLHERRAGAILPRAPRRQGPCQRGRFSTRHLRGEYRETMFGRVGKDRVVGAAWGTLFTAILAALIIAGSRSLQHFDAALVGYTFAVLFSTFAITYRYAMWLQRPPTKRYWNRGWQLFFKPTYLASNIRNWFARVTSDFAMNRFIFRRQASR